MCRLVVELNPHTISPSPEKQRELGVADETLLVRVGPHRALTLHATESGAWAITEFDFLDGNLTPMRVSVTDLADEHVAGAVLSAAIASIDEQLSWTDDKRVHDELRPALGRHASILRQRQITSTGRVIIGESAEAKLEIEDAVG